ncbi:MAG: PKD domain-containing protein, partial [Planctomycetes bacterium]|nr:PKD domain-containing protein [Planctomycetota bacterium]
MRRITATGIAAVMTFSVLLLAGGCPLSPSTGGTTGGTVFNIAPTPVVTSDVTRGIVPLTVQFGSDRSTDDGLIISRQWDFADGFTSQEVSPRHTFTATGEFNVELTLTDDAGGTSSRSLTIIVTDAPVPVITTDRTVIEAAPGVVNFAATDSFDPDGTIVEFRWDFGDGSREFLETVPHQFASAGNYKVTLTVTDNVGVQARANVIIQVGIAQPSIEIRIPPPDIGNIVVSEDSPLWIQAVYTVDPAASHFIHAGIDGDRDICDAQYAQFSLSTGGVTQRIVGHGDQVTRALFSPNGQMILTSSLDGTLRLTNATTGAFIRQITATGPVNCAAFSPDGNSIVYGAENGDVVLVQTADGAVVRTFASHVGAVNDVLFSPSGVQIFSAGADRRAILWNAADGTILRDFLHALPVHALAFQPADPTIVATGAAATRVQLWNIPRGENLPS